MSAIADQEDMGLPLYEKFGLVKMKNEMEYNIGI